MRISYPTLGVLAGSLLGSAAIAQNAATNPQPTPPAGSAATSHPLSPALERLVGQPIFSDPPQNISLFEFNYGEPGSPVLPLVGVQADQITRVESVRRFGLSLLTGIASSETGPAIGIDFSPFWLLARGPISLADYRGYSDLTRIFARTKVAAAASRGNEANAVPSSLVLSLSTKLLARQDPLMHDTFGNCVRGTIGPMLDEVRRTASEASSQVVDGDAAEAVDQQVTAAGLQQIRPRLTTAYQQCASQLATEMSRHSSFDVGAGFRLTGSPGHFRDMQGSGFIVWGTFATGVPGGDPNRSGSLSRAIGMQVRGVVHGRYTFSEDIFDENGVRTGQADSGLLVAGVESVPIPDQPESLRWSLQAGWTRQDAPNAASEDRNYWRFLGLARLRIFEGLWLNGTLGRVQGRGVEEDTYVTLGFSFAPAAGSAGIDNFFRRTR